MLIHITNDLIQFISQLYAATIILGVSVINSCEGVFKNSSLPGEAEDVFLSHLEPQRLRDRKIYRGIYIFERFRFGILHTVDVDRC